MPFQSILESLVRHRPGITGALLLDSEGEQVVAAGARDYRHRLIGAYQGIALATARNTAGRYFVGEIRCMVCRYDEATLILRPLKDGYYLVVCVGPERDVAPTIHLSERAQILMNEAL